MPVKVYSSLLEARTSVQTWVPDSYSKFLHRVLRMGNFKISGSLRFFGRTYSYRPSEDYMQFMKPKKLNNLKFRR